MVSSTLLMGLGKEMVDALVMTRAQWLVNPPYRTHVKDLYSLGWFTKLCSIEQGHQFRRARCLQRNPPLDKPSTEVVPLEESNEDEDDNGLYRS